MTKFSKNYNGESIGAGEIMIPFEYTDLDAENCKNPECIRSLRVGGKNFKVIYKAVPKEWGKVGTSALTLVQNEELGHYFYEGAVSMDEMMDDYELAFGKTESAEEDLIKAEELEETIEKFVSLMKTLIEKSAKLGYAVLLAQSGIKGEEFYNKMKLSHNPANRVQKQAENILKVGIANFDVNSITGYKNKFEEEYKSEAYKLLDEIVAMCR